MKKHTVLKILFAITPIVTTLPVVCSSCSSKGAFNLKIDGSNWLGRIEGGFEPADYEIDWQNKTVTYNHSTNFRAKNLVIPDYIVFGDAKLQVVLGKSCFINNSRLSGSITLNSFTDTIPERCFENCVLIEKVIFTCFPKKVEKRAFMGCLLAQYFSVIKDGYEYKNWAIQLESIGDYAFYQCVIDTQCFVLGENLEYLGSWAFYSCFAIVEVNMQLCQKLTTICNSAFYGCFSIKKVYLPNSITTIEDNVFTNCSHLQQLCLPDNPNEELMNISLGNSTFRNCTKLTGFNKRCNITAIGDSCFDSAKSLDFFPWTYVEDGKQILIGPKAFFNCSFSKIVFTPTIADIGDLAFTQNSAVILDFTQVTYNSIVKNWTGSRIFFQPPAIGTVILSKNDKEPIEVWTTFLTSQGLTINEPGESGAWNIRYSD